MAFLTTCAPAHAQQFGAIPLEFCGTTEQVEKTLSQKYNETVQFTGIKGAKHIERLFYNSDTGSYTFVRTNIAKGISCILSSGSYAQQTVTPPWKPQL